MMSNPKAYERDQWVAGIPDDPRPELTVPTEGEISPGERIDRARVNSPWKKKQMEVRFLLTSLNSLSATLFAAISVAERQVAVLQDLHSVFLTSYRTKAKDGEKGYPLRQNPFFKNVALIPILSDNSQQIWPNTLDTIDEVVRERKSFIMKVKGLVENMEVRREIV